MNRVDYQKQLDQILAGIYVNNRKRLLLHSCCAPCSSYVLEYLTRFFDITVFYYNPNIMEKTEYHKRVAEQHRLIEEMSKLYKKEILMVEGTYEPVRFLQEIHGLEDCPEGQERCRKCFALRLNEAASYAAGHHFDCYTTTLTISPMKNAAVLNEIGEAMGEKHQIAFLPSDFKKREGYKRSIELSKEYGLYRQNYCGCDFSKPKEERI